MSKQFNAIRFINDIEYRDITENGDILPHEGDYVWSHLKVVHSFVYENNFKDLYEIARDLDAPRDSKYTHVVLLNLPKSTPRGEGYYIKQWVDERAGRELNFGVFLDEYDMADGTTDEILVYIVPEYKSKYIKPEYIVDIKPIKEMLTENKEAINKMPKTQKTENTGVIELGVGKLEGNESYAMLYSKIRDIQNINENTFRAVFQDLNFEEEIGMEYRGMPIEVKWTYIPVVTDGLAEVKLVQLSQASNYAILLPEGVSTFYNSLLEDVSEDFVTEINSSINLLGEVYGFDSRDKEFIDLTKDSYLLSGNQCLPYRLTPQGEVDASDVFDEEDSGTGSGGGTGGLAGIGADDNASMFGDIGADEGTFTDIPDIDTNFESYKRFKKESNSLDKLLKKVYNRVPNVVRESIKKGTIGNNVLVIEVDNKKIYDTYSNLTQHAKNILTTIGETIRENKDVQLLDSVMHKNKRLFVIAENNAQNLWYAKTDKLNTYTEGMGAIVPLKGKAIVLERSSVRISNRQRQAVTYIGNTIAFIEKK